MSYYPSIKGTLAYMTSIPPCDLCEIDYGRKVSAVYDCRVRGSWAYVCEDHFKAYDCKLGIGRGQRLVLVKPMPVVDRTNLNAQLFDQVKAQVNLIDAYELVTTKHKTGK